MNKKIIAIAIASALAAPVAMADVKISGAFGGDLVNTTDDFAAHLAADVDKNVTAMEDNGASKIEFLATSGSAYGKFGFAIGPGANSGEYIVDPTTLAADGTITTAVTKAKASKGSVTYRDYFLGYNFANGSSFQFGNMAGAMKNLEKDPYIASFLQTRGSFASANTSSTAAKQKAGAYGSGGFVNNLLQYKMKAGAATITVQYDPTTNNNSSANEGHTGLSVTGKGAGINYWVGYNNGAGSDKGQLNAGATPKDSNMKLGGSMKFGAVKAGLNYTTADNGTNKWNALAVSADMGLGNGLSVGATVATTSGDSVKKGEFSRITIGKSIGPKAKLYAGYTNNKAKGGTAISQVGVGMSVKF